jgi:hypothetical protein
MTTGDQALPQPLDTEPESLREPLPLPVLKREALIRSFRWIFAAGGLISLTENTFTIHSLIVDGYFNYLLSDKDWRPFAEFIFWLGLEFTFFALLFFLLSRPRRGARLVFVLSALILLWIFGSVVAYYDGLPGLSYINLERYTYTLALLAQLILVYTPMGRKVYSPEARAYFADPGSPRLPEHYWPGVVFAVLGVANTCYHWLTMVGIR